jgi:hypothetical protein
MGDIEGKKEFYRKAAEALTTAGYRFFDGDREIPCKDRHHQINTHVV